MVAGLVSSTFHLANPRNAWRAMMRVRTSWLSREAVLAVVFFPAFDWAISPTHPEREERLLYTQDQVMEEGVFDIPGIVEFKPDLVVYEQGATVGLLAAARAGVPAIQRNQSAWRTRGMHASIAAFLTDLMEKHQVALPKPSVTIESFPPSLLLEAEPEGWFMRWVPYGGGAVLGDRLPAERELAEKLQVSRPTLREALAELEERGLVVARPGGGTFIAEVLGSAFAPALIELFATHDTALFDYLDFRRDLEGLAAAPAPPPRGISWRFIAAVLVLATLAAVNQALETAKATAEQEMAKATGGMGGGLGIPGL